MAVLKSPQQMNIRRNLILSLSMFLGAAWAETTVLQNFTLIDGTGSQPLAKASMVIVDGRIKWVGPGARLRLPAGGQNGRSARDGSCGADDDGRVPAPPPMPATVSP